jgi:hypothetical protein
MLSSLCVLRRALLGLPAIQAALLLLVPAISLPAQDTTPPEGEPIVRAINPAKLRYDILVDGRLMGDDPAAKKFKTLQAAYAAAPAGTAEKPTVIGIAPNVYAITGEGTTPGLTITKEYITLLGLTDNRRTVVLADNRGNKMGGGGENAAGGSSNGYVVIVNATGFTAKNLTILNYCNVDYAYPGDPSKNLTKRSATITQAVALQASGDRHIYENVALLSRLDTMFLRTTRSYLRNVFLEGTDDFVGGGTLSVWEDCRIVFPTGSGVMSASGVVFIRCRFEAERGLQWYKVEFRSAERPNALIDCVLPVSSPRAPIAWVRGQAAPRPSQYSLTYRNKDATGAPALIYDSSVGAPAFTYSRELSATEARAYNPWNLLRATPTGVADEWDPAGVRAKYEAAGEGSLVYRIALTNNGAASVRTGEAGVTIGATVAPARATDATITWSTDSKLVALNHTTGPDVIVTGKNAGQPTYVPITAMAANGFRVTAWVYVEPAYVAPPNLASGPTLGAPKEGKVTVSYAYDLAGREDQSLITWSVCDDVNGANAREVAVSRGNIPLKAYTLTPADAGKFLKVAVQPKHNVSDPGPAVTTISKDPIPAAAITSAAIAPEFRNFVTTPNDTFVSGRWTVHGTWAAVAGEKFVHGYGVRAGSQGAALLYQEDGKRGDMQIALTMTPEKTEGMGFGSPGGSQDGDRVQKSDIYIKYDPRTKTGYALRFWRTTESTKKCRYQLYRIDHGVGTPLDDQQAYTGVFKPSTEFVLKVEGTRFTATARNDVDGETLALSATITPNDFGGAGVMWNGTVPRGNSNVYSRFEISYPGAK